MIVVCPVNVPGSVLTTSKACCAYCDDMENKLCLVYAQLVSMLPNVPAQPVHEFHLRSV